MQLSAQGLRSSWLDNSRFLYTGASDCHIYITDVIGWQPVGVWRNAHDNSVFAVSGKGEVLLTGGRDAHLKAHHLSGGQLISNQPAHWFTINAICPMNAISCFATASRDKTIRIWNDADVTPLYTLDVQRGGHVNSVNALHWNEEMKLLASAGDDRIIRLWSLV
jgi:WD repeat-containing protein 61